MYANLMVDFLQALQDNLVLSIVLGVIAVLIVALTVVLIVLTVKACKLAVAKKAQPAPAEAPAAPVSEETPEPQEAPAEEPAAQAEPSAEEKPQTYFAPAPIFPQQTEEPETPAPAPAAEEEPAEEEAEEKEDETMKKDGTEEKKPIAKRASASPYVYKPGRTEEPAPAPAKSSAGGKWVIEEVKGRYWFSLYANNGQVMLESATPYATLSSARSGIKTYQDNIAANRLEITEHKNGDFQVQILNARGGLLATSSTYNSRGDCEKALESIKRWATSTTIEEAGKDE